MALNDQVPHTDASLADPTRTCTRKRAYPTEAVAKLSVSAIRANSPGAQVRPYGCRHCGQWHVGGVPIAEQVYGEPIVVLDDSFDAERARRRRDRVGKPPRRRAYGEHTKSAAPRRRRLDRDDD